MKSLILGLLKLKADAWIGEALQATDGVEEPLLDAMKYALSTGGKRLRPILAMLGARIAGGSEEQVKRFATAVELVHTYSLVHDDLPSMDNDELRRGQPTVHVKYGESIAVLTGDALLNLAYETLFDEIETDFSERSVKAAKLLANAAGAKGMIKGQILDLSSTPTPPEVVDEYKTGELFRAAVLGGAILAGASDGLLEALEEYALNFGKAFQVADDVADYLAGERVGVNYVVCYGLEKAVSDCKTFVENAKCAVKPFKGREEFWSLADEILAKMPL